MFYTPTDKIHIGWSRQNQKDLSEFKGTDGRLMKWSGGWCSNQGNNGWNERCVMYIYRDYDDNSFCWFDVVCAGSYLAYPLCVYQPKEPVVMITEATTTTWWSFQNISIKK